MQCTTNNLKYTNTKFTKQLAQTNFRKHIFENSYPGRGIVLGKNRENSWILIYWIMGRSSSSRSRIFKYENRILRTEAIASPLHQDPNFIIYNVMRDVDERIVVTNGSHTDVICEKLKQGENFFSSLNLERHESDSPNFTPRIAGLIEQSESSISMAKICKSDFSFNHSSYHFFRYPKIKSGYGYCITTYMRDGDPPPNFQGDPLLLPLEGDAEEIANKYWKKLDANNRISLFTREIIKPGKDKLKIINRFE